MSPGRACVQRRCRWGLLTLTTVLAATAVIGPADARHRFFRHHAAAQESYDPAYASIIVDANSGLTMQASNADSPRHPASLTKLMTLYLLFEQLQSGKLKMNTELPVSEHAASMAPSKLDLKPGESVDIGTAIRAIVTKSANDVAVVVAEAIGGNELAFAQEMTAKARALGMMHTNYHNASGLPDEAQITTARDQSILARALHDRFPQYFHYFSMQNFVYRGKTIRNHNHLLGSVPGVDGMKTGYIHESGFNIVVSVHRDNRALVAVVFGGRSAPARDVRVVSLINNNINVAAVKHTAPMVVEGWQTHIAQAPAAPKEKVEKVAAAAPAQAIQVADATPAPQAAPIAAAPPPQAQPQVQQVAAAAPLAPPVAPPLAAPGPQPGSTDPIKPLLVRTVSVQPGMMHTASLSPLPSASRTLTPPSANANPPVVTTVNTVKTTTPPPPAKPTHPTQFASASANVPVPAAAAQELAAKPRGGWMIQVGALDNETDAKQRLTTAQSKAKDQLGEASPFTEPVTKGDKTLYRARFAGLEKTQAEAACKNLKRSEIPCMLLKN